MAPNLNRVPGSARIRLAVLSGLFLAAIGVFGLYSCESGHLVAHAHAVVGEIYSIDNTDPLPRYLMTPKANSMMQEAAKAYGQPVSWQVRKGSAKPMSGEWVVSLSVKRELRLTTETHYGFGRGPVRIVTVGATD